MKATNPKTGRSTTRAVSKLWINDDTDLTDLTVRSATGITSVIDTTARHPFWDTTTSRWTPVDLLAMDAGLRTAPGGTLTVVATEVVPGSE